MKQIVLTGGIASGKTTVSNYLKNQKNILILDADILSRSVFYKNYQALCDLFQYDGDDLRAYLAKNVFKNKEMLKKLEGFMQSLIDEEIDKFKQENKDKFFIFDCALFFEKYTKTDNDFVILVSIPYEMQVQRLMSRNGLSEIEAKERIAAQMSVEEKRVLSDIEIVNDGSQEDLFKKVEDILTKLPR